MSLLATYNAISRQWCSGPACEEAYLSVLRKPKVLLFASL